MIITLVAIFIILALISILSLKKVPYSRLLFVSIGLGLILISGFRPAGIDRDYYSYVQTFIDLKRFSFFIEPTFQFIVWVIKTYFHSDIVLLFIFYAALGVGLKFYAFKKLSKFWFLSLLIYFSYSYILQDMTQIRAGVAAAFVLLSIKPLYERNLFKFLILVTIASLFHYSAIIIFPIWFLKPDEIKKSRYLIAIPIAYIIHFSVRIDFNSLVNIAYFQFLQHKLLAYQQDDFGYLNVFNVWQLFRIVFSYLLIWKANLIFKKNSYGYLFIKLYVISTCAYVLLAFNPSFAGRIGDLFAIGDTVSIPFLVYIIDQKNMTRIIIILIGFSYLFLNLFYNKIIM